MTSNFQHQNKKLNCLTTEYKDKLHRIYLLLSLIPRHTSAVCVKWFFLCLFSMSWCFSVVLSVPTSFDLFFMTEVFDPFTRPSPPHHRLVTCLGLALVST